MKVTSTTIPASKARSNFYTLLDDVSNKLKRYVITRRGEAKVILMHPDEVASWEETMDILSDKKLVADIARSEKEFKSNKTTNEDDLLKEIRVSREDIK